jgi:hypothetical protein
MGGRAWLTAGLLLLLPSAASTADIEWTLSKKDGRAYLTGMPKQSEVDNEFWAHCRADGAIDVGAGAESHVGRGNGEAVTLKLSAGLKRATLTGVSRDSANSEMTGGVELRAVVARGHPLFAVLANGKPIKVSGPIRPMTWPVNGLKARATDFLKDCK